MYIQNIGFSGSQLLDEVLLNASENAIGGGAAYAFISKSGLEIYIEDDKFTSFLADNEFTLIIGIDEITNLPTLHKLEELQDRYPNLSVKVFYNPSRNELFHPKFSWFKYEEGGKLIIGSGNLTLKGLRKNVEVFSIENLTAERMLEVETYWNAWLDESENYLKNLNDADVIAKAIENQRRFNSSRPAPTPVTAETAPVTMVVPTTEHVLPLDEAENNQDYDEDVWSFDNNNLALIAEIPGSGNRWKQANFSKHVFEHFFGVIPNAVGHLRILLRNVSNDGMLQDIESRPGVSVSSDNHRFELNAGSGIDYPENGAPIGVFIRVAPRTFIYCLSFPEDAHYTALIDFLNASYDGPPSNKKRVIVGCNEIEHIISLLPLESLRH